MTENDVFKVICSEKVKLDKIEKKNDLVKWYWNVGFKSFSINENNKFIQCFVDRPNKFIGKWNKEYINFLVYIQNYFNTLGYTFDLSKANNSFYSFVQEISNELNLR